MADDFYSAAIPEPTTILGLRLRTFSLGHVVLLNRIKSSFVCHDEPQTLDDIALSTLICSLNYSDGCSLFNRTDLPRLFARWHRKLEGGLLVTLGLRKPQRIDYAAKADALAAYIKLGSRIPNYSYDPQDFKPMACPSVQVIKVSLMRDLHIPEAELMDRSWAVCLWDYVTAKALAGHVRMVDGDDIADAQAVAEKVAQAIRERGGLCR